MLPSFILKSHDLTRRAFDPQSIKLVIFDLDGTLIDSRLDLVHSVNAALRHIGRPELPDDVIASYVGDGAPILIQRALGGEAVDDAVVRQGLQFFLSYYREHKLDHTTVYAGVARGSRLHSAGIEQDAAHDGGALEQAGGSVASDRRSPWISPFFTQIYGGNSFATKKLNSGRCAQICWKKMACVRKKPRSSATLMSTLRPVATPGSGVWV